MAGASDEIRIRIITETKQAVREIATWAAGITAAVATVKKISAAVSEMTEAFYEQEKAEAKLNATLRATGGAIGYTSGQLAAMASAMQRTTVFGDEAVMEAEALMLTYGNIGHETFPRVLQAAADLSTVLGQDLKTSVTQLGVALEDPAEGMTRLRRAGIVFTDEQRDMVKALQESGDVIGAQNIILKALEDRVGGAAKMMGDTAWGATEKFKNAIGDLKETMGKSIAEGQKPFVEWLTRIVTSLNDAEAGSRKLEQVLRGTFTDTTVPLEDLFTALAELDRRLEALPKDTEFTLFGVGSNESAKRMRAALESERALLIQRIRYAEVAAKYGERANDAQQQEIKNAQALVAWLEKVNSAWAGTPEGKKAALELKIAEFEDMLKGAVATAPKIRDILKDLREQLATMNGIAVNAQEIFDLHEADKQAMVDVTAECRAQQELFDQYEGDTYQVLETVKKTVGPVTEIADLWGDASQYTKEVKENLGTVMPSVSRLESSADLIARDFEELQAGIGAAAKILKGDFTGAMQSVLSMAGPEGALVGSIIGFASDIVDALNAALNGETEFATSLASGLSSLFATAMADSDWTDFRKAMAEKVRAAVAEAVAESALLAPYIENFSKRLQKYIFNPSDRNYRLLQEAYVAMMNAGENAASVAETILSGLPGASGQVAGAPTVTTPTTVTAMPSGARSVVVNFNGPTFGDEPTMRRYVVSAVQEAAGGY